MRFFLGAAEAGFLPGVIVYLTHWFRYGDRGKADRFFLCCQSSFLRGWLADRRLAARDLMAWAEGLEMVVYSGRHSRDCVRCDPRSFYLTDWPAQARWLPADERTWIIEQLQREKQAKKKSSSFLEHLGGAGATAM